MKHTGRQTTTATITDMYRAMDRKQPVTITYTRSDGTETIRTIEIADIRTTAKGDVILRAADRESGEMRTFRIDRIQTYTRHAGATYQVQLGADETPTTAPIIVRSAAQLVALELGRDYHPTRRATALPLNYRFAA